MFSPIMRIQEYNNVSDTKAITETKIVQKRYYNYSEKTIKKTTIRVHDTTKTTPELTMILMNFQKIVSH